VPIPVITFSLVTLASLVLAAFVLRRRSWCVLDPTVLFWFGFALYYGAANIWFCWDESRDGLRNRGGDIFDQHTSDDVDSLVMVAGLTVVYGTAVAFGMFVLGPIVSRVQSDWLTRKLLTGPDIAMGLLVPLCLLHWFVQFGLASKVGVGLPSAILGVPLVCCLALNVKLAYETARHPVGRRLVTALGVLGISMLGGAIGGMKEALLLPAFAAFAGLMLAVRRPWPIAIAVVTAIPAFLALKAWNDSNRSVMWDQTVKLSTRDRLAVLVDNIGESSEADDAETYFEGMRRLCTAEPMLQTLGLVRNKDGISLVDGLIIPHVPRALWPDKPSVVVGGVLYEKFTGHTGSSSGPTQPAEAFMYGGWVGVVVIGCALGLLGSIAGRVVQQLWHTRKAASLGALVLVAMNFAKCENWFWTYLPSLLNGIVILLGLRLGTFWLSRLSPTGLRADRAPRRVAVTHE
jgi:hypothetical protein